MGMTGKFASKAKSLNVVHPKMMTTNPFRTVGRIPVTLGFLLSVLAVCNAADAHPSDANFFTGSVAKYFRLTDKYWYLVVYSETGVKCHLQHHTDVEGAAPCGRKVYTCFLAGGGFDNSGNMKIPENRTLEIPGCALGDKPTCHLSKSWRRELPGVPEIVIFGAEKQDDWLEADDMFNCTTRHKEFMQLHDPEKENRCYYYDVTHNKFLYVTNTALDGNEENKIRTSKVTLIEIGDWIKFCGIPVPYNPLIGYEFHVGAVAPVQPAKGKARRRLSSGEEILRHHRIANPHKDSPVLLKLLQQTAKAQKK